MDALLYDEDQLSLKARVRDFVREEILPVALEYDARREVPTGIYRKFFETGLLHSHIPREYGGKSLGTVDTTIIAEEVAYGCGGIAAAFMIPICPITAILRFGSEEQKRKYLLPLASKFSLPAIACKEENAGGTDLRSIETRAERADGGYRINGLKHICSNVHYADFVVVIARTEAGEGQGSPRCLSAFVVEASNPGFSVVKRWDTLGLRTQAVGQCRFREAWVPESARIGLEGDGLAIISRSLNMSRTMIGAMGTGGCRRLASELMAFSRRRKHGTSKLYKFQDYRFNLVRIEEAAATTRLLTWIAAKAMDAGLENDKEVALAKLHAGKAVQEAAQTGLTMVGGAGYMEGSIMEKLYRDAKSVGLVEGPDPIQSELVFAQMISAGLY